MQINVVEKISLHMRDLSVEELLKSIDSIDDLEQRDRDGRTLLINAAFCRCTEIVRYLLSQNVNVNAVDKSGFSALHAAVQENCIEIVDLLLNAGADINIRNQFGNPPIWGITGSSSPDLIKLLMRSGADPHIKNNFGISTFEGMVAYPNILDILNHQY